MPRRLNNSTAVSVAEPIDRTWPSAAATRAVVVGIVARGGAMDGAARQLSYLVRHVDRARFTPIVFLDHDGPLADELRAAAVGVCITRMRPWRSVRGWPFRRFDAAALSRECRTRDVRLVHCSDPWRGPYAARAARTLGVPLVMHVRGPTTRRDLEKNHCLGADAIVGIAERYRAEIESAGFPRERVAICNDAVDGHAYRFDRAGGAAFRAGVAGGGERVIGLVGRVEPFKRVLEFADLVAAFPRDVPARFVVVGDLRREAYVRDVEARVAALGIRDRLSLVGRRDDMRAVLSGLDVLVTLSGGSVMFEAQACGVPVLSVRADGRHSQHTRHDETAWCATTDEATVAADALAALLGDDVRRSRIGDAGRAYVLDRLSPATMARETEAVYARVLAARAAAASAAS